MDEEQRKRMAQLYNAQPQAVASLPPDNVNRSILNQRVPEFPTGAGASIATPQIPATRQAATGELRGRGDVISGGRMGMDRTPIQTPYGTIYATQEQSANLAAAPSRTLAQQSSRSPAEQQALLTQMRTQGAAIGERLVGEQTNRYYAFRQSLAEKEAQKALTPSYGGYVGNIERTRAANALLEAEAMKQAQQGRSPLSQEPISALGYQFQRGSMGQYNPMRSMTTSSGLVPSGGPQPSTSFGTQFASGGQATTMAVGGSPISFTPFAQRTNQQEASPLSRFTAAIRPQTVDQRFRPLPFGMRQFGTV